MKKENKIFQKYTTSDVVFLSIISLITLLSCSPMAAVAPFLPVTFGVAYLVTTFQISLFFTIGLLRVKKTGSLIIMTTIMGSVMLIMSWPMFAGFFIVALLLELLSIIFFKGFHDNSQIILFVILFTPLNVVVNYFINLIIKQDKMILVASKNHGATIGIFIAIIALGILGSFLGYIISKELEKIKQRKNRNV